MKLCSRFVAGLCAAALVAAAHAADPPPPAPPLALADAGFALKPPQRQAVGYRGMADFDRASAGTGQMMYPAPGLAGFLVAIATHGVLVESSKNAEKTRLQAAADKVLDPYREALAGFADAELMQRALATLDTKGATRLLDPAQPDTGWVVESVPVFTMTQDQRALILDNAIAVYRGDAPTAIRYQNVVRVVSNARTEDDPGPAWAAEQSRLLKEQSVALYAHSLKLLFQELAASSGTEAAMHKTFRFAEGKAERMERAQLIGETCGRAVIKTLRGWLMSVPLRRPADAAQADDCRHPDLP